MVIAGVVCDDSSVNRFGLWGAECHQFLCSFRCLLVV